MEQEVYKSKFIIAKYDDVKKLIILKYMLETANMSNNEWDSWMRDLITLTDKYKPQYILSDNRQRRYAYSPEIQKNIAKDIAKHWIEIGLKKYAQVMPTDLLGSMSTYQLSDLINNQFPNMIENVCFDDYYDALKWIIIKQ